MCRAGGGMIILWHMGDVIVFPYSRISFKKSFHWVREQIQIGLCQFDNLYDKFYIVTLYKLTLKWLTKPKPVKHYQERGI
jgi:hypothetical protein